MGGRRGAVTGAVCGSGSFFEPEVWEPRSEGVVGKEERTHYSLNRPSFERSDAAWSFMNFRVA